MMTQKQFDKEFGDMMLHGLDSNGTYIPLRTNKSAGINVSIRPMVYRLSEGLVLFGGKLRVGYTMDKPNSTPKKSVTDISQKVAAERLKNFCKGFTWMKADARRFSTVVGFSVVASIYDGKDALAAIEESQLAAQFLNKLEKKYKQYNDVGFTANKKKAIRALNAAWALQSNHVFIYDTDAPTTSTHTKGVVGLNSGVLNKAHKNYKDNVVSFADKVEEIAKKTKDSE